MCAEIMLWDGASSLSGGYGKSAPLARENVFVYFKDGDVLYDPISGTAKVQISKEGVPQSVMTSAVLLDSVNKWYALERISTGFYKFSFMNNLAAGLYEIKFMGTHTTYGDVTIPGKFSVGTASRTEDMLADLRVKLQDFDPSGYILIDNTKNAWNDYELIRHLEDSMNTINNAPPQSFYTLETFGYHSLVELGAMASALRAASIRETWNKMQYTDELSLIIDRAPHFAQVAQQLQQEFDKKVEDWKYYWALYGEDGEGAGAGIGMGSQTLPFQISRILSWMPNMKNVWGI